MTIKLIALDMDDTLLDSKLAVSPRASAAIRKAAEQGIKVTIATGRMYRSALPYAQQLGLDVPLITYNGGLIKSCFSGETLLHRPIDKDIAREVLSLCREQNLYIQTYVDDNLYVKEQNEYSELYSRMSRVPAIAVGDSLYAGEGYSTKMLIMSSKEGIREIYNSFKKIFGNKLSMAISKPTFMEITHPEVNKGKALAYLADKLMIKQDEVMAVGDSGNDVDMLKYAGWGVAMGNASAAIKAIARLETASNDADGVAEAIERYALN